MMEHRLANSWRMSINEKAFIKDVLLSNLRIDGRLPFDYRNLTIDLGREDGQAEVQLGHTRVMAYVSSQLVQPYRDRANEGTLSIFTEFSPMSDPSFEAGRPGDFAVELGRVIDRGLRESRAIDMESLCVAAGKFVWAIRVDLQILDNGGNLIDAANAATLAALLTFRCPDCAIGDGQEVTVYPPEAREPLPLMVHHLPIAVTFAIFNEGNNLVIDPTYHEEVVMGGRITVTINPGGDICAVQKAGGEGITSNVVMQCMRIASAKAAEFASKIEKAVAMHNEGRLQRKIKQHTVSSDLEINMTNIDIKKDEIEELRSHIERLKSGPDECCSSEGYGSAGSLKSRPSFTKLRNTGAFIGCSLNWDPYSKVISSDFLKCMVSPAVTSDRVPIEVNKEQERKNNVEESKEAKKVDVNAGSHSPTADASIQRQKKSSPKSLKDAVKPKGQRRK